MRLRSFKNILVRWDHESANNPFGRSSMKPFELGRKANSGRRMPASSERNYPLPMTADFLDTAKQSSMFCLMSTLVLVRQSSDEARVSPMHEREVPRIRPSSFENVPVGPSAEQREAHRLVRRFATVRGPLWPFKSVAVNPGQATFTLIAVPSSSCANAIVTR